VPEDWGIKNENKTVGTEGEPNKYNNPRYAVSIFIPQTFIEEYRANEKQDQAFDKRRYRLEKSALAVAAFYAAITLMLWLNAKSTTTIDQRAWIFPEGTTFGIVNEKASTRVIFRNTGKTPGSKVKMWDCAQVRETDLPENAPLDSQYCASHVFGVLGPNVI